MKIPKKYLNTNTNKDITLYSPKHPNEGKPIWDSIKWSSFIEPGNMWDARIIRNRPFTPVLVG